MEFTTGKSFLKEVHYRIALVKVVEDLDAVARMEMTNFTPISYVDYDRAKEDCDLFNSLHEPLYVVVKFDVGGRLDESGTRFKR